MSSELLRGFVERVVVRRADDGLEIELVGAIAKMIELSGGPENLDHERRESEGVAGSV